MAKVTRLEHPAQELPEGPVCDCEQRRRELEDQDRWLALLIRQGLKVIVTGIEKRYGLEHDTVRDRRAA